MLRDLVLECRVHQIKMQTINANPMNAPTHAPTTAEREMAELLTAAEFPDASGSADEDEEEGPGSGRTIGVPLTSGGALSIGFATLSVARIRVVGAGELPVCVTTPVRIGA